MGTQAATRASSVVAACVLLVLNCGASAAAATRIDEHCGSDGEYVRHELPADGLDIGIADAAQWLEVEESGQVVRFENPVPGQIDLPQPLRFGWRWRPVHQGEVVAIRRLDANNARGDVRLALHCASSVALDARLDWLHRASAQAGDLNRSVAQEKLASLLDAAQTLIDTAVDARTRAFAVHMRANAFGSNGRSLDSAAGFAEAKAAWHALGDTNRELAAAVGQAGLSYLAGQYAAAIALTANPAQVGDSELSYFRVRLEGVRCLSLQALGKLHDADACYRWVLARFLALGELAEYAVNLQNSASLLRDAGDLDGAIRLGEQALQAVTGSDAAMVRGRIHVMLADLELRAGRVNRSLIESDAALDAFDAARQNVQRWQANVYLHIARIYTQMGAYSEAYDALAAAVAKLGPADAPSRFAVAMQDFADLESATGKPQSALLWQRAAEQLYVGLGMAAELDSTRARRVDLQLQVGDLAGAERAIAQRGKGFAANDDLWTQLNADVAFQRGDTDAARAALRALDRMPLSLDGQIRAASLRARIDAASGDSARAQDDLVAAASALKTLAGQAGSPELRYLLGRQILPLRHVAFELALERFDTNHDTSMVIDTIWPWLQLSALDDAAMRPSSAATADFDRTVAQDLLATSAAHRSKAESAAQRHLLSSITAPAQPSAAASASREISFHVLQATLRPGQTLLAYLDGGSRAGLLVLTHDSVDLHAAAPQAQIAAAGSGLDALLQDPAKSVATIATSADRLSSLVLQPLAGDALPAQLLVLSDGNGTMDRIAWSVLHWPGAQQPLVETTSVALARLSAQSRAQAGSGASRIEVLIAAPRSQGDKLAPLTDADSEPDVIARAVRDRTVATQDASTIGIDTLASMLGESGAWVHMTSHGSAQPNRLGYSGIWLIADTAGRDPRFLSSLDVLGLRARADLVVLNACQLAARGDIVAANLSFADAVSLAGARQVVASLWSVSDAATLLWDPAFYRAIDADSNHDAADALRQAQLRLRASRHFAHPFYWAGMQAIVHVDIAGATESVATSPATATQ